MARWPLIVAAFCLFPLGAGCSDDPVSAPFGPGQNVTGSSSGPDASAPASTPPAPTTPAAKDAGGPVDAGYRDPRATDGGCAAPNQVCSGKCVAVGSDVDNCGQCGNQCTGPGAACNAGRCTCTGPLFDYCQGAGCMDVSSDVNNCGQCGNVCDPNNFNACISGACDNE